MRAYGQSVACLAGASGTPLSSTCGRTAAATSNTVPAAAAMVTIGS